MAQRNAKGARSDDSVARSRITPPYPVRTGREDAILSLERRLQRATSEDQISAIVHDINEIERQVQSEIAER
jgi:hypothetical protein